MAEKGNNLWIGIGRLGRDPETRYTPSGVTVVNFSMACSEVWKDKETREIREKTEWIPCVCFGKKGEAIAEYVPKGGRLFVTGRIQTRRWEDNDGNTRYKTEIVVEDFNFLDTRGAVKKQYDGPPGMEDDDIPF